VGQDSILQAGFSTGLFELRSAPRERREIGLNPRQALTPIPAARVLHSYRRKRRVQEIRPMRDQTGGGRPSHVGVRLEIGQLSDSITITGEPPLLETETSSRASTIENRFLVRGIAIHLLTVGLDSQRRD